MTTDEPNSGRTAATAPRRIRRTSRFLLVALLGAAAFPAVAAPGLAGDSADQLPVASTISQQLADPLPAGGPEVLFASDVNQLIAAADLIRQEAAARPEPARAGVQTLLQRAMTLLGTPYRWGGTSPERGFDCSGLVSYVFRTALGIELPRVSRDMASAGQRVARDQLDAGDLVFFSRRGSRIDHVGIYLGEGRFLHAPRSGRDVTVSELDTGYWAGKFMQARRVAGV
ncbi:C40 family peptidase [Luteimonas huabeiensis]|uniref:C40 family peptidase n=1 Tax=Luteimonas huabeiensis TaxID=1244513 RepID=UPI000467E933|nr:C40 family peptidase [Luteimonas huabeiensis]